MQRVRIYDRGNVEFPFGRDVFEDRQVLYHGSWSTYSQRIESVGFIPETRPFHTNPFTAVSKALESVGWPSERLMSKAFALTPAYSYTELYLTPSFWGARAYATDGGGEVVRHTIRDAKVVEALIASAAARRARIEELERAIIQEEERRRQLESQWAQELEWKRDMYSAEEIKEEEGHHAYYRRQWSSFEPTRSVIATLNDDEAMEGLLVTVRQAHEELLMLGEGGYPVVYAIRVEPEWFGDQWGVYLGRWEAGSASMELLCRETIGPDRLVAKAEYLQGTDDTFSPDCTTWEQVLQEAGAR